MKISTMRNTITVKGISLEVSVKKSEMLVFEVGQNTILMELRKDDCLFEWYAAKASDKLYFFKNDVITQCAKLYKKSFNGK